MEILLAFLTYIILLALIFLAIVVLRFYIVGGIIGTLIGAIIAWIWGPEGSASNYAEWGFYIGCGLTMLVFIKDSLFMAVGGAVGYGIGYLINLMIHWTPMAEANILIACTLLGAASLSTMAKQGLFDGIKGLQDLARDMNKGDSSSGTSSSNNTNAADEFRTCNYCCHCPHWHCEIHDRDVKPDETCWKFELGMK